MFMKYDFWVLPVALLAGGCVSGGNEPAPHQQSQRPVVSESKTPNGFSSVLTWGNGAASVALQPRAPEQAAQGPSAVAVGPRGAAYVLDRLNGRVLQVTAEAVRPVASVARDAEDLAVGVDFEAATLLAAYSPLRARVWLHTPRGPAGEIAVPRALRQIRGVALDGAGQVWVHTAFQERYRLGSPRAAQPLAGVLHSKREGEYLLADDSGVAVRLLPDGRPELLWFGPGRRAPVTQRIPLPDHVLAARVVGVADGQVCLRLEKPGPGTGISVVREVVCIDLSNGLETLRRALPQPGRYLPRRELAVGGTPARLAFIHAADQGLAVHVWVLERADR